MRPRSASVAVAAVALSTLLAGCSGGALIEVPESASPTIASAARSAGEGTARSATDTLDCAAALPASRIEKDLALPEGAVGQPEPSTDGCAYAIAGNPSAIVLTMEPGRLADTFKRAGRAQGATPAPLGTAAYWRRGDAREPSELAVLAGGIEVHLVSSVGEQTTLVSWAVAMLASQGVTLVVA
ncbi:MULTISPECIES: hypothetical protein [unclassified Rathayibacter]|uniref:hypothetical protein n=1 Tax=unclassified Rathayibacter TaxID=2609250 RepID=UPI00188D6174|nr:MULTISPECIES: hypothetical protein [unclassified Rathayibacter]MBF4461624.1 hypothetical protein [Rathayibacter sp. VKM Ac-2879]MBF4503035.1 hypothetical protein [Rathayibacter sp. VKM Ac-2878]